MLLEEDNPDNRFILKLIILARIDILEELASLATILPDKASSISNKKLPAFVAKLGRSDMSVMIVFIELCEYFL